MKSIDRKLGIIATACCIAQGALLATAQPIELLKNGSFETGDFTGWTVNVTGGPLIPWMVATAGQGYWGNSAPIEGKYEALNGFDGQGPLEFTMVQSVFIPPNHSATLAWSDRVQWWISKGAQPRTHSVLIRDPVSQSVLQVVYKFTANGNSMQEDTQWLSHSSNLDAYAGRTIQLVFLQSVPESYTGPGTIELDAISILAEVMDSDGDGIGDKEDCCPNSDLSPTVTIAYCDSGVKNQLFSDGCTMSDKINAVGAASKNHGQYVSGVTVLVNQWRKAGVLSSQEGGKIVSCAARSPTP